MSESLVERLRQGDQAAMAEYIEQHREKLLAFIKHNASDALVRRVDPEDILQEVCVDCVRSVNEVDLSQGEPYGWVCEVAKRRIIDAHRHWFGAQKRDARRDVPLGSPGGDTQHAAVIDLLIASITSPSAAFSRQQREFQMLQVVQTLPAETQEVIRMRYVEGLPTKEISARLGKSDASIRVLLTRTIKKLQQLLEAAEGA